MASHSYAHREEVHQAWRPDGRNALYLQVAEELKRDIVSGRYPVGSQLPTEAELRDRFSVSRHTVREALRCLREDRLVASRQGSGTVVIPPHNGDKLLLDTPSVSDLAVANGDSFTAIESVRLERLDEATAARIGARAGEEWLTIRGLGRCHGEQAPLCLCESFVHRDFAGIGRLVPRHVGPIFLLIEELYAQRIAEIEQRITAGRLSAEAARILGARMTGASVELMRRFQTTGGDIAQIGVQTYPADRFCLQNRMQRS